MAEVFIISQGLKRGRVCYDVITRVIVMIMTIIILMITVMTYDFVATRR